MIILYTLYALSASLCNTTRVHDSMMQFAILSEINKRPKPDPMYRASAHRALNLLVIKE